MNHKILMLALILVFLIGCAQQETEQETIEETIQGIIETADYEYEVVFDNLNSPWGMHFLNSTHLLITEKGGDMKLLNIETKQYETLSGLPSIDVVGQGGLLDINFDGRYVYITYSAGNSQGYTTHLGRGVLNIDSVSIDDFEVLRIAEPFMSGGAHFGSRIVLQDDYVFFSTGDRGRKDFGPDHISQDTSNELGAVMRLYKNGSVPSDNPFVDDDSVIDSIYTYGHRNVQGMTLHPQTGQIWVSEHGENDGDEINILQAGGNYGWPITHTGCRYGTNIPVAEDPFDNPDVVDPAYYWRCGTGGFPPAGMTFYIGDRYEEYQGNLFLGNLAGQYLGRFEVINGQVTELEPLLEDAGWRIRDVAQSPDDYLYVLTDNGYLVRIS